MQESVVSQYSDAQEGGWDPSDGTIETLTRDVLGRVNRNLGHGHGPWSMVPGHEEGGQELTFHREGGLGSAPFWGRSAAER